MIHIKSTYIYITIIVLGLLVFLFDYYELIDPVISEYLLFVISLTKATYFIYLVFKTIKDTADKKFYFKDFITFAVVSILLVIISFSIDYYCLFRINPGGFSGIIPKENLLTEFISFFYYSISVFTTAGFGDIKPNSTSAQVVSMELMIAFFFTILFIANISHIRSSYIKREIKL